MICFYFLKNQHFAIRLTTTQLVINNPQTDFRTLKVWFYDNFLALNPQKCHFTTLANGGNLLATFRVIT